MGKMGSRKASIAELGWAEQERGMHKEAGRILPDYRISV